MSRWAELVFHVLAHVQATAHLASSVHDPRWIARVARVARTEGRTLAEDAAVLGRAAPSFESLASVQLLAWLFEDDARAAACCDRPLASLGAADVDDPSILPLLTRPPTLAAAEVLRAAAELESEVYASLPPPTIDPSEALAAARALAVVAPVLARATIEVVRPLGLRGRVRGARIWIGAPDEGGPTVEHVAWQAAHEATVAEVSSRAAELALPRAHAAIEHTALVLLSERAGEAGLAEPHARWVAHFRSVPPLARDALPERYRALT